MLTSTSIRWLVVAVSAAMLLAVVAACAGETVEVPGETVVVEKVVTETVEVPGETVVVEKEVIKTVEVAGETVTKEVIKTVEVPGETVVVEKEVVKTVEVPGETVTVEVVKEVMVPGETVVVEQEVVKTVEVPGETVVVEKVVVQEVPGQKYVTDPTTGRTVVAPQYGGTMILVDRPTWTKSADPYYGASNIRSVVELLGIGNWGIDRTEFAFQGPIPVSALKGQLAQKWEMPDDKTYVMHIREGVNWHNKAPMNGRELTAKDVEYNFHRILGLGSGAAAVPFQTNLQRLSWESISATDEWTVVFKLKEPSLDALNIILLDGGGFIMPPEAIEQYGDIKDWRNLVGTGAFMMTDWVEGSSITWEKNPDYWGYDEKYPENRLPYVDAVRGQNLPEMATRMAAMRSGKVDFMGMRGDRLKSLDLAESLKKTNPELVLHEAMFRNDNVLAMNVTKPPFDDIRVRRALQMAVDVETISATYFRGVTDPTPQGRVAVPGWYIPYEQWPEEVKKGYMYDPEGARQLLAEAGYPNGFKTTAELESAKPIGWQPIAVEYWRAIGVDVETQLLSEAVGVDNILNHSYPGFTMWAIAGGNGYPPLNMLGGWHSGSGFNPPGVNDPVYDDLVDKARAATSIEEQKRWVIEADMRAIEQQWLIWGPKLPLWLVHQPWVIGYNAELNIGGGTDVIWARLWIDQELKRAMGH